jgi:hypothetical protein
MLKTDIEEERKRQKDRKIEQRKDRATEKSEKPKPIFYQS